MHHHIVLAEHQCKRIPFHVGLTQAQQAHVVIVQTQAELRFNFFKFYDFGHEFQLYLANVGILSVNLC